MNRGPAATRDDPTMRSDETEASSGAEVEAGREDEPGRADRVVRAARGFARANWLFLMLAAVGIALRVVASIAYDPALLRKDAVGYLRVASLPPRPWQFHPIVYPTFLRALPFDWELAVVPAAQHVMGMGIAALIYATLVRLNVRRWLAALAAAPILLDAYQLNLEQHVLAETLFELLLVVGCALLLWRRPLGIGIAALAGVAFAAAALTRSIGIVAFAPALLAALLLAWELPWRARLARPAALAALFVLPLLAYAAWFQAWHGHFALTSYSGRFLYGRVAPLADCSRFSVPQREAELCPEQPIGQRPTPNEFVWSRKLSPIYRVDVPAGERLDEVVGDFTRRVIVNQPLDYLEAVGSDLVRAFAPVRDSRRNEIPVSPFRFGAVYFAPGEDRDWARSSPPRYPLRYDLVRADSRLASFLRTYQRFAYTPGPLLALAVILGFVAALGVGHARESGLRSAALLFAGVGFVLVLGSVASTVFSWRYQLPQIVLLPPAAAVGLTALLGLRNRSQSAAV